MKAKTPTQKAGSGRRKVFVYGPSGWGKTLLLLRLFPRAVVIDTEHGCDHYGDLIREQGSVLLQTVDAREAIEEVRSLLSEKHEFRTVIIDPITILYQSLQDKWGQVFQADQKRRGQPSLTEDYGWRYWGCVKGEHKRLNSLLLQLDMNVAVTAHSRTDYDENSRRAGVTFDGLRGLDHLFDNVIYGELTKMGNRVAHVIKERAWPKPALPPQFEKSILEVIQTAWDTDDTRREAVPVELATPEQVKEIEGLASLGLVPEDGLAKWKTAASADDWSDFPKDKLQKCVDRLKKLLAERQKGNGDQ